LYHAPLIVLQVLLVFGVHSTQLTIERILGEERVDEELGETVECAV
jgi:hypothetical protein